MRHELTVTLDEEDFVDAYRPAPRPQRLGRLLLILAALLALLIAVLLVRYPDARLAYTGSPLIIGLSGAVSLAALMVAALLAAAPALRRRAARSTLAEHPGMRDPIHYAFDGEHFEISSTFARARYPWAELWDWRETERIVLILPTPRNFYIVPKRALDPLMLDALRGHLGQSRKRVTFGVQSDKPAAS